MSAPDRSLAAQDVRESRMYREAVALVHERHAGQLDPAGLPMPEHFERVAARLLRLFPHATDSQDQAALLHDAFEPDGISRERLVSAGIAAEALRIIERITLPADGREYLEYSCGLARSGDTAAIEVKLADNLDAVDLLPQYRHTMPGLDAVQLSAQLLVVGHPDGVAARGNFSIAGHIALGVDGGVVKGVDRAQAGHALAGVEAGAVGRTVQVLFRSISKRPCPPQTRTGGPCASRCQGAGALRP
jgi:hypothetical protein